MDDNLPTNIKRAKSPKAFSIKSTSYRVNLEASRSTGLEEIRVKVSRRANSPQRPRSYENVDFIASHRCSRGHGFESR